MDTLPFYVHPLAMTTETLPEAFTYPFRYTAHPLCERAAAMVSEEVKRMGFVEGKMFGVLVVKSRTRFLPLGKGVDGSLKTCRNESFPSWGDFKGSEGRESHSLFFLAAYSGQLNGSYDHPWFVPPVVDYLDPDSHFQKVQREIMEISRKLEEMRGNEERQGWQRQVAQLRKEREAVVTEAKKVYAEGKRPTSGPYLEGGASSGLCGEAGSQSSCSCDAYIRLRQFQKANIQRAKQLHKQEIAELEAKLAEHNAAIHELYEKRKRLSEVLQQWLFQQFSFLNAKGERKNLLEIFGPSSQSTRRGENRFSDDNLLRGTETPPLAEGVREGPPSGAGECCAPKLLQVAYLLGLQPLAMAEFWLGPSKPGHYRQPGAFFPACRRKCYPILGHMLQGLNVEPDPALHYDNMLLDPVRILWEDESLAVIVKPEGWCSIPGKSDQPNLLDEAHRLWPDITGSVIVHRLDQDTSGVMVVAKNGRTHHALCQQFEQREVRKTYVALLSRENENLPSTGDSWCPSLETSSGTISLPLGPDLDNLPRQRVDLEHGKEAITIFEVLGREMCNGVPVTRVRFRPQTGRTHQLRVHAASPEGLGSPILGDRLYGHVADRLYLHAEAISFVHPLTHERLHFEMQAPF